ncbi:hypothetical protein [Pseudomonas japonica]|uniref:hypothetical protein n=1 Tax=Pseudomonas japonica TaxID=256466 RepID=UPI003A839ECF
MSDQTLSLDALYQAIEDRVMEAIPGLEAVCFMPAHMTSLPVPMVLLELVELEPGQDQGTGETAIVARFEARAIVGAEQEDCYRQAAFIASRLAVLLRIQDWGQEVGHAEFLQASQDFTRPELDGYAVWVVEWTQALYLGDEEWPWPNQPPGTLRIGFSPNTGPGQEGEYIEPGGLA